MWVDMNLFYTYFEFELILLFRPLLNTNFLHKIKKLGIVFLDLREYSEVARNAEVGHALPFKKDPSRGISQ